MSVNDFNFFIQKVKEITTVSGVSGDDSYAAALEAIENPKC